MGWMDGWVRSLLLWVLNKASALNPEPDPPSYALVLCRMPEEISGETSGSEGQVAGLICMIQWE